MKETSTWRFVAGYALLVLFLPLAVLRNAVDWLCDHIVDLADWIVGRNNW